MSLEVEGDRGGMFPEAWWIPSSISELSFGSSVALIQLGEGRAQEKTSEVRSQNDLGEHQVWSVKIEMCYCVHSSRRAALGLLCALEHSVPNIVLGTQRA